MKAKIRNIGNSKGVILPKNVLEQCAIEEDIIIEVKNSRIIITPASVPKRKGWDEAFKMMAANGDDELVIPDVFNDENIDDWTWK